MRIQIGIGLVLPVLIAGLLALAQHACADGGVPLWTNIYNGPGSNLDVATGIAVDGSGNVFVTGYSVGATGLDDYATLAYSGSGVPLWTNRYAGPVVGNQVAQAIAVNGSGNVFVTGYSYGGSGTQYDYATVAYSDGGVPLWTNRYNGLGSSNDFATAIAIDDRGNVYVTGYSWVSTSSGRYDYATVKYSSNGIFQWDQRYKASLHTDHPYAIATDRGGNVFVTGSAQIGVYEGVSEYATVAFSESGAELWARRYFLGSGPNEPKALAVDRDGNVIVTGTVTSEDYPNTDYATLKYSGAGVPLWTNRYPHGEAKGLAVDSQGTAFVTGYGYFPDGSVDFVTVAYSSAGVPLWTNRYGGPGQGDAIASAVAVDSSGNVFVTGYSRNNRGDFDYATVAYSGYGTALWTNRFDGTGNTNDQAYAMTVDRSGNVYVTGYSTNPAGDQDYATIKYASSIKAYLAAYGASNRLVLNWTNGGFYLQSAPTSSGIFTNVPGATSPYTNAITGAQQFFRLISQ